ncbi:TIR domain-containing protein [Paracidovorax oryzae]|uniref:TIR domain-containing protein n=1 Tax=Paracidovorax oryzae TaxID=862720 RepID=UPI0035D0735B
MSDKDDLYAVAKTALATSKEIEGDAFAKPLASLEREAARAAKAWSGSWLGHHSRVYYQNLESPPPGARFSQEWGFQDTYTIPSTVGDWVEVDYDDLIKYIEQQAGNPDISSIEKAAEKASELFDELKSKLTSRLSNVIRKNPDDKFIEELLVQAKSLKVFSVNDFIAHMRPKGQLMSRDMLAIEKGLCTPPHVAVFANVHSLKQPFQACQELGKIAQRAASHLSDRDEKTVQQERIGTNVFLGHGRSSAWKDLRDFIRDRMHLPWDEFNRVPVAGFTNIARLSQMLDGAAIAFIIMTAEDEQVDGKMHARMNVIHEAGLFQGRLGFERAILLLEEGCEEFSNVQGLSQIRFPAGNISAVFENIRQVLEREGLVQ